jgi:gluconokinase
MGIGDPFPCKRPLVVMGVSGAGKTKVGMSIARKHGVPYADADDFHSEAAVSKMTGGEPLHDEDRRPWLESMGAWLQSHCDGSVVSCSALKRRYRDTLRSYAPTAYFLHLSCNPDLAEQRVDAREGHFMPSTLIASQFEDLEPLEADEAGVTIEVTPTKSVEAVVAEFLEGARVEA